MEGVEEMNTGVVEWFDAKKGYGFITGADGKNIFVHYSNILASGYKTLEVGQKVRFDIAPTEKGNKAINVAVED